MGGDRGNVGRVVARGSEPIGEANVGAPTRRHGLLHGLFTTVSLGRVIVTSVAEVEHPIP